MSFFENLNNATQEQSLIKAGKVIPIEILSAEEKGSYVKLECKTLLTDFIFTTNLQQNKSPFSPIRKLVDAIVPKVECIEDLMNAKVAAVFNINHAINCTYYNLTNAFPMEDALLEVLANFEQPTEYVEEVFDDEFEEDEAPPILQSKLTSTLQSNTTGKLGNRLPSKLGSKTDKGTPKLGTIKRQNRPPVNANVESMLEEDDE